jgi:SOS-response transcriptional repressor LexA
MIGLTARQMDGLRFIAGFQAAKGYSPSYVEIAKGIGLSGETSKHAVYRLVTGLCERGAIRRLPHRERAIEVLVPVAIPRAPDGAPLFFVPVEGLSS